MKPTKTLPEAISQGYVVIRDKYSLSNLYWRHCCRNKVPFVRITLKAIYAIVSVDLDPFENPRMRFSPKTAEDLEELFRKNNRRKYREVMADASSGGGYAYATRIPIEKAADLAKACFDILNREDALVTRDDFRRLQT